MEKVDIIAKFQKFAQMPPNLQGVWRDEILDLFEEFWAAEPTSQEYSDALNGIRLFPEMIYIMVKGKRKVVV